MIFDLDRKPLVMGIERRPFGHSPGFENAIQLEPQIVVEAGGVVLLDDEAATGRGLDSVLAAWLPRLLEVALRFVGGQLVVRHRRPRGGRQIRNASDKNMFRPGKESLVTARSDLRGSIKRYASPTA